MDFFSRPLHRATTPKRDRRGPSETLGEDGALPPTHAHPRPTQQGLREPLEPGLGHGLLIGHAASRDLADLVPVLFHVGAQGLILLIHAEG